MNTNFWIPAILGVLAFVSLCGFSAWLINAANKPRVLWFVVNPNLREPALAAFRAWGLDDKQLVEATSAKNALLVIQSGPSGGDTAWIFQRGSQFVLRVNETLLVRYSLSKDPEYWVGIITAGLAVPFGPRAERMNNRLIAVGKPNKTVGTQDLAFLQSALAGNTCLVARRF